MEILSAKDFIEKLKSDNLKPAFIIKGIVKKSDNESTLMFAGVPDFSNWVRLPVSLIESVIVLKSMTGRGGTSAFVKLHLKQPSNQETKVLYDSIACYSAEDHSGLMGYDIQDHSHEKLGHGYRYGYYLPLI